MDRLEKKNELFMKLGALFSPLRRLVEGPQLYDEQERAEVIARYCAEYPTLIQEFQHFSTSQPGHDYIIQHHKFHDALYGVMTELKAGERDLAAILSDKIPIAQSAIAAIPIPRDSTIFEAQTPFSTYCKLKDLVECDATSSLVWVDAYMASSIFHRFLRHVNLQVTVSLVTCQPKPSAGKRDKDRWDAFLDVSRMYAMERGAGCYQLIVHQGLLHDRWLLLDNKRLYTLGGSAKDAGDKQYFTLARLDASTENLEKIKKHIDTGTEYFGPNTTNHR